MHSKMQTANMGSRTAMDNSLQKCTTPGCTKPLESQLGSMAQRQDAIVALLSHCSYSLTTFNTNSMRNDSALMTEQTAAAGIKEVGEALIALNDFTVFFFFSVRSLCCLHANRMTEQLTAALYCNASRFARGHRLPSVCSTFFSCLFSKV